MLIIEGGDLVGKTTVCKKLCSYLYLQKGGYVYQHLSRLPSGFDRCKGYMALASRCSVRDRFHMSEIIYAKVRKENTALSPERYRLIDAHLRMLGAYTVVITAEEELIKARSRDDEMYSMAQILRANEYFNTKLECWMDCDAHFHCTVEKPFLTKQDLDHIIDAYARRQAVVLKEYNNEARFS